MNVPGSPDISVQDYNGNNAANLSNPAMMPIPAGIIAVNNVSVPTPPAGPYPDNGEVYFANVSAQPLISGKLIVSINYLGCQ